MSLIKFLKKSFFMWGVICLSYLAYRLFKYGQEPILLNVITGVDVYLIHQVCKKIYRKEKNNDTHKGDDKK